MTQTTRQTLPQVQIILNLDVVPLLHISVVRTVDQVTQKEIHIRDYASSRTVLVLYNPAEPQIQ